MKIYAKQCGISIRVYICHKGTVSCAKMRAKPFRQSILSFFAASFPVKRYGTAKKVGMPPRKKEVSYSFTVKHSTTIMHYFCEKVNRSHVLFTFCPHRTGVDTARREKIKCRLRGIEMKQTKFLHKNAIFLHNCDGARICLDTARRIGYNDDEMQDRSILQEKRKNRKGYHL